MRFVDIDKVLDQIDCFFAGAIVALEFANEPFEEFEMFLNALKARINKVVDEELVYEEKIAKENTEEEQHD